MGYVSIMIGAIRLFNIYQKTYSSAGFIKL